MICIPIIAGEGGSDNAKKLEKGLAGRCLTMRGGRSPLCTPRFSLSTEGRVGHPSFFARGWRPSALPKWGPSAPTTPKSGRSAPRPEGFCGAVVPAPTGRALRPSTPGGVYAGLAAPAPTSGPTRPTPGVPFVSRRKEPKACRGCAPGPPEGGTLSPLRRCRTPQIGFQPQK